MSGFKLKHKAVLASALLVAGVVVVSGASDVFAGFEWKGPGSSRPAPQATQQQAPHDYIRWDQNMPAMPAQKVAPVEAMPVPLTAVAAAPEWIPADNDVISGFGSDLPLLVAVQQIVPGGYNVFVNEGVNPNVTVSWQGSRPWRQVLAESLAAAGLGFQQQNPTTLTIGNISGDRYTTAMGRGLPDVTKQHLTPPSKADMIPPGLMAEAPQAAPPPDMAPVRLAPATGRVEAPKPVEIPAPRMAAPPAPAPMPAPVSELAEVPTINVAPAPAAIAPQPVAEPVTKLAAQEKQDNAVAPAQEANGVWLAQQGRTLREILADWAQKKGVELYWSIDYDYRMNDSISYNGSFEEAVGHLLDNFSQARPQPYGELHLARSGPQVLVVGSYDLPH